MDKLRFLLLICLTTLIFGQIIRIPIGSFQSLTLSDISVITTGVWFIIYFLFSKRKLILPAKIFYSFLIFTSFALASTILALNFLSLSQVLISLLFLIRLVFYFFVAVFTSNVVKKLEIKSFLNFLLVIGLIFSLLGIIQIIVFADLSFLTAYGWDPHVKRLVSSLIDPNFTGILLIFFLNLSISIYLSIKKNIYLILSLVFFISFVLTFSRSSYLAFLVSMLVIGVLKSPRVIFLSLAVFTVAILLLPRAQERILGAFAFDETALARIESWQSAYSIFEKNWLFGVGFNTFRYVQADLGSFTFDEPLGGHSASGTDSSLLLVAATTGIVGLTSFMIFLFFIFKSLIKNVRINYLNLASLASFLALLVHSQFVNSFFFPQVMLVFFFLLGLSLIKE